MKYTRVPIECKFCHKQTGYFDVQDQRGFLIEQLEQKRLDVQNKEEMIEKLSAFEESPKAIYDSGKLQDHADVLRVQMNAIEEELKTLPVDNPNVDRVLREVADSRCEDCEKIHGKFDANDK